MLEDQGVDVVCHGIFLMLEAAVNSVRKVAAGALGLRARQQAGGEAVD